MKCGKEERKKAEGGEREDTTLSMLQKVLKIHPENIVKFSLILERIL
jgi:hypothetical protein